jgi:hypothetical protein
MTKFMCAVLCAMAGMLRATPAAAVQIVAPAAGTTLAPGATLTVRVVPSPGEQLTAVAVGMGDAGTDATASTTVTGAFEAQITVPVKAVGPAFIVAYATLASGSTGMDYLEVTVEPGAVKQLRLSAPPVLSTVGAVRQLDVSGLFTDGVERRLTLPDTGTTYESSDQAVLGIHPSGLIQARATGTAAVRATNRGQSVTAVVRVSIPDPPPNHIPTADPGGDQVVAPKTLVRLSGAGSRDPDGDPLTYRWEQDSGRIVVLQSPLAADTVFVAPRLDTEEVLEFSLVVTDSKGASTFPAIVRVTVRP